MGEMLNNIPPEALDDRELMKVEAMIQSMTRQERRDPDVLSGSESRFARIARGSGRPIEEVRALYERFLQVRQMMGQLGQSGMFGGGGGGGLFGGMNPFGGGGNPLTGGRSQRRGGGAANPFGMFGAPTVDTTSSAPELSREEKLRLARQRREARKNRKKNRRNKK